MTKRLLVMVISVLLGLSFLGVCDAADDNDAREINLSSLKGIPYRDHFCYGKDGDTGESSKFWDISLKDNKGNTTTSVSVIEGFVVESILAYGLPPATGTGQNVADGIPIAIMKKSAGAKIAMEGGNLSSYQGVTLWPLFSLHNGGASGSIASFKLYLRQDEYVQINPQKTPLKGSVCMTLFGYLIGKEKK